MSTTVELCRVKAELAALRAGVESLADIAAHSSCIHLNDMFGQLSRLLASDADA